MSRRCIPVLPLDDRRVGKLADECDRLDEARAPKAERMAAYERLARAVELAARNASALSDHKSLPGGLS